MKETVMTKQILVKVKNKNLRQSMNSLLADLLHKRLLEGILVPQTLPSKESVVQTLVTEPDKLKGADIFAPVLPVSSAHIVSHMTRVAASPRPLGLVMRPCEIRALVELVKLKQASLENLVIIGIDCLGTYSVTDYADMVSRKEDPTHVLLGGAKEGKEDPHLRSACRVCEYSVPTFGDLMVGLIGLDWEKEVLLEAGSDKGKKILAALNMGSSGRSIQREKMVSEFSQKRMKKRDELFSKVKKEISGWENLSELFATCINCHNCMVACPICYCKECFFNSSTFEFEPAKYLGQASKKGVLKMPTDTLLFHLGRMNHMAISCVGSG
jgi:formate dehydrogenase subunit beta